MRRGLRIVLMVVLLLVALAVLGWVGSMIPQIISPDHTHGMGQFIDRIWWPASAVRFVVYVVLAWLVFPRVVRQREQHALTQLDRLASAEEESTDEWSTWHTHWQHLQRVSHRTHWVFLALVGSDLMMAQFPYFLLLK